MLEAALVSCDDHLDLNMLPADALHVFERDGGARRDP